MKETKDDFRKWHFLRRNIKTTTPSNLIFVDTETISRPCPDNPNRQMLSLRLWCACCCRMEGEEVTRTQWATGQTCASFWAWCLTKLHDKQATWLFAHNLGFDLTILKFWELLENEALVLRDCVFPPDESGGEREPSSWSGFVCLNDPPTIIKARVQGTKKTLVCVDSLNYFPVSLETLSASVGNHKLPMPGPNDSTEAWAVYCTRDVEILMASVIGLTAFIQANDLGEFGYTGAHQAMRAYRHRFMPEKSILIHGSKAACELERKVYYGGLCQCRKIGDAGPIHVMDVQSFYPSIMADYRAPVALMVHKESLDAEVLLEQNSGIDCAAWVTLETEHYDYPVRKDGMLIMARGRFSTYLAGPELSSALARGSIVAVHEAARYRLASIFQSYVDYFWAQRLLYKQSGNRAWEMFCKMMLNALHGKFGQRKARWRDEHTVYAPKPWGTWIERDLASQETSSWRSIAWMPQKSYDQEEHDDSFPAISAWITSWGRRLMQERIQDAFPENVYYVDTDSIHVNDAGMANLKAKEVYKDSEPGYLRHVLTAETARYRGPKNYTLAGKHTIAGVKKKSEQVSPGIFKQQEFQNLESILSDRPDGRVAVTERLIDARPFVPRDTVDEHGRVLPIVLDER